MIHVRPAGETDASAWQSFLGRTWSGDFLHDWEWAEVAAFDGQPQRRFVAEQDGELVAIVAAQVRSLPLGRSFWYVPHGPVLDYEHPQAFDRLRAVSIALREAARADGGIAVKLEPRIPASSTAAGFFERLRLRREPMTLQVGQTRLVPLADDDALLAAFDKDTRYAVRRAEREGVEVTVLDDAADLAAVDRLHALVVETQHRAGFPMPSRERYRLVWRRLAGAGRARILEARHSGRLLASGMLVLEGARSFYLYAGSLREAPGEPKRYATYALQWAMMRAARGAGARLHDLWGVAPPGAGPEHRWYGVGLFKKGVGGDEVAWAGTWDIVVSAEVYRLRRALAIARGARRRMLRR
jgi:lipid II:glycine glycyltransferase (peptidoglycan interpeptide bridge formation enzyme)